MELSNYRERADWYSSDALVVSFVVASGLVGSLQADIDKLEADNKALKEALEAVHTDLLERASIASDGMKVVDCGASVWIQLKDTLKMVKGENELTLEEAHFLLNKHQNEWDLAASLAGKMGRASMTTKRPVIDDYFKG